MFRNTDSGYLRKKRHAGRGVTLLLNMSVHSPSSLRFLSTADEIIFSTFPSVLNLVETTVALIKDLLECSVKKRPA
jgi:hypothetical protein